MFTLYIDVHTHLCYYILVAREKQGGLRKMDEEMVFKSYLRKLLRDLKDLKEAANKKDLEEVKKLIDQLIEDTQKDIED